MPVGLETDVVRWCVHHNMQKRHLVIGDSTTQRSIIVSDGFNLPCGAGQRSSFILPSLIPMGALRVERSRPSLTQSSLASVVATSRFGAGPLEHAIQTGSPASISLSASRRAAKCRCLPEIVPANCLNPQSNLMRQVMLRRRPIQQYGHTDRGRVLLEERGKSSKVNMYYESLLLRVRIDGPTMETHSLLEYPHVSCVRAPVSGISSFGADGPAAPRQRPCTVSQN